MENENFIEKLASIFGQNASVKNVYGEPIRVGDKTIIPVAQIAYGLGGGYGKRREKNRDFKPGEAPLTDKDGSAGEKGGGGGGLHAMPKGVYEVTPDTTRFIPANNLKQLLICFTAGFLVRKMFFSKHNKLKDKR